MESLELCTHWVMECFVAIRYTAKAFYVLGISIRGLGVRVKGIFKQKSYELWTCERILYLEAVGKVNGE